MSKRTRVIVWVTALAGVLAAAAVGHAEGAKPAPNPLPKRPAPPTPYQDQLRLQLATVTTEAVMLRERGRGAAGEELERAVRRSRARVEMPFQAVSDKADEPELHVIA